MARQLILKNLMKLAQNIGANPQRFMGTRTNVTFLGKGPTKNPLFQGPLRGIESASETQLGPRETIIEAVEDAMGFASANKLNAIQLRALTLNLESINKIYNPPVLPMASVADMVPGIRGLKVSKDLGFKNPEMYGRAQPGSTMAKAIDESVDIKPGLKFFEGAELPEKTASARATMLKLLDMSATKEGVGLTLREIMSKQDLKWLLEGGGGTKGDPITLFAKYFGNASAKQLPSAGTPEVIDNFALQIIRRTDRMVRMVDDPFFRREDLDFAHGGLARILEV